MIFREFIKKNKWNIIAILIFSISIVYYAYNKNTIAVTFAILCTLLWIISCLKRQYAFLGGIAVILYAIFILIVRIDLWLGAIACIIIGLLILFFCQKKNK